MKKISNEDLITEFHAKSTNSYPGITFEQGKDICMTPWKFLKEEMENGELSEVRFKYFGTFQVYCGRAEIMLSNLKERFKINKIKREEFFRIKDMLDNFLKKQKNGTN